MRIGLHIEFYPIVSGSGLHRRLLISYAQRDGNFSLAQAQCRLTQHEVDRSSRRENPERRKSFVFLQVELLHCIIFSHKVGRSLAHAYCAAAAHLGPARTRLLKHGHTLANFILKSVELEFYGILISSNRCNICKI